MTSRVGDPVTNESFAQGRYEIREILGTGGMAIVFRVYDKRLALERALKVLAPHRIGTEDRQRHLEEAQLAARLEHPNLLTVHDVFEDGERLCTVMALAQGTLADWIQAHGLLSAGQALHAFLGLVDGLSAAHDAGVIHRDIKPQNILLHEDGRLLLGDFGVARQHRADGSLTDTGAVLGSIAFMAPEQRLDSSTVDVRADIYALAGTLLWSLTGRTPLDLYASEAGLDSVADLPSAIRDFLVSATAMTVEERPKTLADFRDEIVKLSKDYPAETGQLGELNTSGFASPLNTIPPGVLIPTLQESQSPTISKSAVANTWLLGILLVMGLFWVVWTLVPSESSAPQNSVQKLVQANAAPSSTSKLADCGEQLTYGQIPVRDMGGRETIHSGFEDIDGDGLVDAVFVQQMDETLTIYWGSQDNQFNDETVIPSGRGYEPPAVGDVDGDGHLDLVVNEIDAAQFRVIRGLGNRKFSKPAVIFQDQRPRQLVLYDWNHDQRLDVVFIGNTGVSWREGLGDGTFKKHVELSEKVQSLVGIDVDGDNKPELLSYDKGRIQQLLSDKNGWVQETKTLTELSTDILGQGGNVRLRPGIQSDTAELLLFNRIRGQMLISVQAKAGAWTACLKARFVEGDIDDVGDFNQDGLLDILNHRTCAGCTSNHNLYLGRKK